MGSTLGSPCWHRSPSLHTECALHGIATEPCGVHQHQPQHHVLGLRGHHREPEGTAGRALDYGEVWACGDRGRIALDPGELGPHEVSVRVAEPCGAFGLHPGEHGSWERDRNDGGRLGDEERDVPEEDCAVSGPGGEDLPVRGEGHRVDPVRMPGEGAELPSRGHVPELDRLVIGPGGEDLPVRGEGHREDPVRMPGEGAELPSRGHVPELDRLVPDPEARIFPSGEKATE
jgi:hypothetical protein